MSLSPQHKWMIAFTVTLLAVVEVLDITIVSVALLSMKGALAATPSQITWTITVYVVTAAIMMPLTGFFTGQFGRKPVLLISAIGFGVTSLLCGLSSSLMEIVIFRGLQGVFGALLPPLAQSTLLDTFPGKESSKAMAVFGVGIMLGPILGPVLGGYITDHLGWRWIFFINVPICIIAVFLTIQYIQDTPKIKKKVDWIGLILLAVAVGSLQYVLDKGNDEGWLNSHHILFFSLLSLSSGIYFVVRGCLTKNHIINFKVFMDRNFSGSSLMMLLYCTALMGTFSWQPLWMEIFMGYPATLTGELLMPRGGACLLIMMLSPILLKHVDARIWVAMACLLFALGSFMMSGFNLQQAPSTLFWPNMIQGVATGLFFVPLMSLAYQSTPKYLLDEASGLLNFFRSLGSSIGVAIFSTIMTQLAQINWHRLGEYMNPFNPALSKWLHANHLSLGEPHTYAHLGQVLTAQANMISFIDANHFFAIMCLFIIPIIFLVKGKKGGDMPMAH